MATWSVTGSSLGVLPRRRDRTHVGLSGEGVPKGLERCPACEAFRGECLFSISEGNEAGGASQKVVLVHCRCDNHNRCSRCGATLADTRLSAYHYNETSRMVLYTAAYEALGHRCSGVA